MDVPVIPSNSSNCLSIKYSPETAETVDTEGRSIFSDYVAGISVVALFLVSGALFYLTGRSASKQPATGSVEN